MSGASQEGPAPRAGEVLADKYVVERVLGEGGMGVVVLARHRDLDARVAVKLLRSRSAPSVEAIERFQREARAAARLRSDHVARVTDVGQLEGGTPYMVLEHLEGADLSELVRGQPVPPALVAELVAQACEAVGEAHQHGIIHRDLKPSNLFVTRTVRGGLRVKVLDFGISKLRAESGDALAATAEGAMLGTPLYMSPEQMRSSRDVDARADVWSLGLVAFELLTGSVPWSTSSLGALVYDVTSRPVPDPSTLVPDLPPGLCAVVSRCLDKSPEGRFPSAIELGAALAPYRQEPTAAAVDGLLARAASGRRAIAVAATTPATPASARAPASATTPASAHTPGAAAAQPTGGLAGEAAPVPAATTRGASAGERRAGPGLAVALGTVGVAIVAAGSMFVGDCVGSGTAPAAPAALAPVGSGLDSSARAGDAARPRPCAATSAATCSDGLHAWCDEHDARVACCGPGLVPTTDGLCDCPPGGATHDDAIAGGCPRATADARAVYDRIRDAIRARLGDFRRCYEAALAANPSLDGRVVFAFTLTPWGDVESARLEGSTLPSPEAQRCILSEVRRLRVAPPPGADPIDVTYPIVLSAEPPPETGATAGTSSPAATEAAETPTRDSSERERGGAREAAGEDEVPASAGGAAGTGLLTLATFPPVDVIFGHTLLGRTPLTRVSLPAGRHTLRLVDEAAGIDERREVVIVRDQLTRSTLRLE